MSYVQSVLNRHVNTTSQWQANGIITILSPHITAWSSGYLVGLQPSGSIAKGTAILDASDVDLLVSVRHDTPGTLKEMYDTLFNRFNGNIYLPRKQNVSIGLSVNGLKVDLVPARKQSAITNDHSLWSHKKQSHRQTNIHKHVQLVTTSGRLNEIRALKVWRKLHNLEMPSFVGEMIVIQALSRRGFIDTDTNFWAVLQYIRDNILSLRIVDPANSNNVITDDLTLAERQALRKQAISSLSQQQWQYVIW